MGIMINGESSGTLFLILLISPIACGMIAAFVQDSYPGKAFAVGFLLGPLGIVIAMLVDFGACNVCGSRVSATAIVCPGCHNKRVKVWIKEDKLIWPCKHCGSIVNNDQKYAGKSFPCPVCKEHISVPAREQVGTMMTVQKRAAKQPA
jgi:RNA polymerase subunit RPABC4/transcription elongation factor Spt4